MKRAFIVDSNGNTIGDKGNIPNANKTRSKIVEAALQKQGYSVETITSSNLYKLIDAENTNALVVVGERGSSGLHFDYALCASQKPTVFLCQKDYYRPDFSPYEIEKLHRNTKTYMHEAGQFDEATFLKTVREAVQSHKSPTYTLPAKV